MQVDHRGEVESVLTGREIADVSRLFPVWTLYCEQATRLDQTLLHRQAIYYLTYLCTQPSNAAIFQLSEFLDTVVRTLTGIPAFLNAAKRCQLG